MLVVAVSLLAAATLVFAGLNPGTGITQTSHDLSSATGKGALNDAGVAADPLLDRICIYCHAPHHTITTTEALAGGITYYPLWNHDLSTTTTWEVYSNTDITNPVIPDNVQHQLNAMLGDPSSISKLLKRAGLDARRQPDWTAWEALVKKVSLTHPKVKIALVGKYVELHDAYMSVREALKHAGLEQDVDVEILWVHSAELEKGRGWEEIHQAGGILVPGGFGSRGIEGKLQAARYARENNVPYLGLCLGMQLMVVDFARMIYNSEEPNSTEFDRSSPYPVIDLMPDQRGVVDMGGTMRLGLYPC